MWSVILTSRGLTALDGSTVAVGLFDDYDKAREWADKHSSVRVGAKIVPYHDKTAYN